MEDDVFSLRRTPIFFENSSTITDTLSHETRANLWREFEFEMTILELADALRAIDKDVPTRMAKLDALSEFSEDINYCTAVENTGERSLYEEHLLQKRHRARRWNHS